MMIRRLLLPVLLLALPAGCADSVFEVKTDSDTGAMHVLWQSQTGLSQRVELSHASPQTGDTLLIRSVLLNAGPAQPVESRICGLDVRGLALERGPRCAAYSMSGLLATGDSLVTADRAVVVAGPGMYRVQVRHLLSPERWVDFTVRVR